MCVWGSKIFTLIFLSIIEALGGEIVEVHCMYSWFSIFMRSAVAGSTSMDSANHGSCSIIVFPIEKQSIYKWTYSVQTMLFKGQLYYVAVAVLNQWRQNTDNYLRTFNSPIGKVKVSIRRIINCFNFPLGKKWHH